MRIKLIVFLGVLGVSFSSVFAKLGTAPSSVLAFYRMGFSVLFLLPAVLAGCREEMKGLSGKQLLLGAGSGFFLACHFWSYFEAVRYTAISSCAVLMHMEIFFVCILSFLLFREKSSRRELAAMVLAFGGSILLAAADYTSGENSITGDLLALLSALCIALHTLIGSRLRQALTNKLYTFLVYGAAALTLLLFHLVSGQSLFGYSRENLLYGLLLCLVCTFLGHSIFNWGLKYLPAAVVSNIKISELVFASVLAWLFFGQIPGNMQILGSLIVMAGLFRYLKVKKEEQE